MKYHPIIMSASSVRGVLAGTKTQTRRVVRGSSDVRWFGWPCDDDAGAVHPMRRCGPAPSPDCVHYHASNGFHHGIMRCPYGGPGDRLWIRETHAFVEPVVDAAGFVTGWQHSSLTDRGHVEAVYRADHDDLPPIPRWRSPLYMPRWASRLTPEIVSIRVERVQEITEADVLAEGWRKRPDVSDDPAVHRDAARDWYSDLWDETNAKRGYSWETSPWVWVIEWRGAE